MIRGMIRRLGKPGRALSALLDYDYASPNLEPLPADIESYFPRVNRGPSWNPWVPHNQRRNWRLRPRIGLVTWDESTLLYNYALRNRGREVLEIGCWIGWSTVVFLIGGARLTVIDPVFLDHPAGKECCDSVARAGFENQVELIGGYSPGSIDALHDAGKTFSLCFIDGNHEGEAPLDDAKACARVSAEDCLLLFHDAIQPNIGAAIEWLGGQGWNYGVHYTSRFLGVAWRGSASPLEHRPDPAVDWDRHIKSECPHLLRIPRL